MLSAAAAAALLALVACGGEGLEPVTVGLVTKQEENPYWVSMRQVAEMVADDNDVTLVSASGTSDVDVASQEAAIEEMVADGVDGILLAPNDSTELLPAIQRAQEAGVLVIALDTPVDPVDAVDAYFATDNLRAGELVGAYAAAKAEELGLQPQVATLDLAPGISSGEQRHDGFRAGFGLAQDDPALVASVDTEGDRELAEQAMRGVLAEHPGVNVVYTVNEPAALGALDALLAADVDLDQVVVVSVDGGCEVIKDAVRPGLIDATAQQYPANMAREGVLSIASAVRDEEPPRGYLDTGLQLVTGDPAPGVDSREVAYGVRNCWGD